MVNSNEYQGFHNTSNPWSSFGNSVTAWGKSLTSNTTTRGWNSAADAQYGGGTAWWDGLAPFDTKQPTGVGDDYTPDYLRDSVDYFPGGYYGRASLNDVIARWNEREAKRLGLDVFTQTQGGYGGNVGKVAPGAGFGAFGQYPGVDGEIQSAADAYGVPANFLKTIIARESSGKWNENSQMRTDIRPEEGGLLPYVGVFRSAATTRGFGQLFDQAISSRATQIQLLAAVLRSQYDEVHGQNPQYGWLNVAAFHYSGDPSGNYTPPDSLKYGTTQEYMASTESWWKQLDAEVNNTWTNYTDGGTTPIKSVGGEWAGVDAWNSQVQAAATKYGVDPNLLKSIMRLESGGKANAVSPQGATGLMQIMPDWNGSDGLSIHDPAQNIMLGAYILKQNYQQYGTWDMAVKAYLGFGVEGDANQMTADPYLAKIKAYQSELTGSGTFGGGAGGGGQLGSIWGGAGIPNISQEFGPTDFSMYEHPEWYTYSLTYGFSAPGHTGIDYGMDPGGMLYTPVGGTVELAGGTGYFTDSRMNPYAPGSGELRIRLDNGHELILGHMESISVKVGDRVTAGQFVGKSGTYNGGHVHVEYRIKDPSTESGWRLVDPRQYLNGQGMGGPVVTTTTQSARRAMDYMDIVRAVARGEEVITEGQYGDTVLGTGWMGFLRNFSLGRDTGPIVTQTVNNALNGGGNPYTGGASLGGVNVSDVPVTGMGAGLVQQAMQYVGYPYVYGTAGPSSFDCSGFVSYLYGKMGISISTGSHQQYSGAGRWVPPGEGLQAGDLLFFDTANGGEWSDGNNASHVALYIGNGQIIHAMNPSTGVVVSSISDPYYQNIYLGAKRVMG